MVTSGPFKLGKIFYETIKNAAGTDKKEDDPYAYGKGGVLIDRKADDQDRGHGGHKKDVSRAAEDS